VKACKEGAGTVEHMTFSDR